jgi:hypothetical protein
MKFHVSDKNMNNFTEPCSCDRSDDEHRILGPIVFLAFHLYSPPLGQASGCDQSTSSIKAVAEAFSGMGMHSEYQCASSSSHFTSCAFPAPFPLVRP